MRLDAFQSELPQAFAGDLNAPHPLDRRFRALVQDVPGMATESKLALLNLAAAHLDRGEAYLEVGSFKGLSLIGAMLGNGHARFYAIENFLEFNLDGSATRAELLGNLARWVDPRRVGLLEGDCFRLLRGDSLLDAPVGVYFYDGAHGRLPHYLALGVAERWLADQALVVIDDASWPMVAQATERYLRRHPGYELLFDLAAERDEDPRWWNGLRVYAFRREAAGREAAGREAAGREAAGGAPAQRAGTHGWPGLDLAWRYLAYDLAYQPAMRLAWRTLPRHQRLASAVLKVVPMSSRRVPECG
jgi:predicted O-methyltransferase YrrM